MSIRECVYGYLGRTSRTGSLVASFGLTCLISLSMFGCSVPAGIDEGRYQRALALVDKGTTFLRERRLADAEAAYAMAYELAPLAAAIDGRGCVAMLEGRYDTAERLFSEAFAMDSTYDEAAGNLALLYEVTGEKQRAKALYEWLLTRRPESPAVRNNLAALNHDLTRDAKTVSHELRKAFSMSGHSIIADNITRVGQR